MGKTRNFDFDSDFTQISLFHFFTNHQKIIEFTIYLQFEWLMQPKNLL